MLTQEIDGFIQELTRVRDRIQNDDQEGLKELMVNSTHRRAFFDKKN